MIVVKLTYHKIDPLKVKSSGTFDAFIMNNDRLYPGIKHCH